MGKTANLSWQWSRKNNKLSQNNREMSRRADQSAVAAIMNFNNQNRQPERLWSCHSERSEESASIEPEILRFAQNDMLRFAQNDMLRFAQNDMLRFAQNDMLRFAQNDMSGRCLPILVVKIHNRALRRLRRPYGISRFIC